MFFVTLTAENVETKTQGTFSQMFPPSFGFSDIVMSQYSFRKICSALRRYGAAGFMVCGAVSVLQRFGWNVKAMWMCDRQLGESDRSTFEAAHCRLADEGWSLRPLRYADFRRLRPLHPDLLDSHLMLQLAEAELHQGIYMMLLLSIGISIQMK